MNYYTSRGYHEVKENFGEDYRGILIHDCRAAHNNTISKTGHKQCNSHLQRDLKFQKRIKKHRDSILLFMNYKSVPFHNNSSEQAIRMTKVKQKISGGHRSQHGVQRHSVLLSIIETVKKQNMDIFISIQNLLNGSLVFQG